MNIYTFNLETYSQSHYFSVSPQGFGRRLAFPLQSFVKLAECLPNSQQRIPSNEAIICYEGKYLDPI